jgi:hypothetical protein
MKFTPGAIFASVLAVVPAFATTLYVDTNNNLYTIDTTTGNTTQVALTETSSPFSFNEARGMAFGANGDLYVADYGAGEVYQVDGSGNVTPFAAIAQAYGVLANGSSLEISTFNAAGQVLTLNSGGATIGTLTTGSTNLADLTYGPNGDLYVSSQGAGAVLQYDGTSWTSFASLAGNSNLPTPRGLVFDGDTLYVADSSTNTQAGSGSGIYAFTISGTDTADGLTASSETEFYNTYNDGTKGLILDPSTSDLYLAESVANEVVQIPDPPAFPVSLTAPEDFTLASATPEPGTMMLMMGGFAIAGFRFRKRIF